MFRSSFAVACVAVTLLSLPAYSKDVIPPVPLRVVTLNTLEGLGTPGQASYEAVARMVTLNDLDGSGPNRGLRPDVVCFQELSQPSPAQLTNFVNANLPGYQIFGNASSGDGFNYTGFVIRPDITVLDFDTIRPSGAPRDSIMVTLQVPGALKTLTIYGVHLKSGSATSDQNTRRGEANTLGRRIYLDRTLGLDYNDDGTRETPAGYIMAMGDFNSNNNNDGTLNGMFTSFIENQPTGLLDLPIEHLIGRVDNVAAPIFWTYRSAGGLTSRLDYIMLDAGLIAPFDVANNGFPLPSEQAELNTLGFVYNSTDNTPEHTPGQFANGDSAASGNASDHRAVVFDLRLDRDPQTYDNPCDIDNDGDVDAEDLVLWENLFANGAAPDVNGDNAVNSNDQRAIEAAIRRNEPASVATH